MPYHGDGDCRKPASIVMHRAGCVTSTILCTGQRAVASVSSLRVCLAGVHHVPTGHWPLSVRLTGCTTRYYTNVTAAVGGRYPTVEPVRADARTKDAPSVSPARPFCCSCSLRSVLARANVGSACQRSSLCLDRVCKSSLGSPGQVPGARSALLAPKLHLLLVRRGPPCLIGPGVLPAHCRDRPRARPQGPQGLQGGLSQAKAPEAAPYQSPSSIHQPAVHHHFSPPLLQSPFVVPASSPSTDPRISPRRLIAYHGPRRGRPCAL